ncbi:MAG: hypothetical protein ACI9U2_002872 [Bradymonadia bacterium]|jgi:hypothetical protein
MGLLGLSLTAFGCDDGDDPSGAGGEGGEGGAVVDMGGGAGGVGGAADMGGGEGGAMADMGGGEGGAGGMMLVEEPIDDRCPDAQAGTYLLVVYPDRVDAYRQNQFEAAFFCEFLDLDGNGITRGTGVVQASDGSFLAVSPEDDRGTIYRFSQNGEFDERVDVNVNLAGIKGIWNTFADDFIVWSAANQNFYRLNQDARFTGPWTPPQWQGSRIEGVTDVTFLDTDAVVMTFNDRPARLFMFPDSPQFPERTGVGAGNAVQAVATAEGVKLLMSAQVGAGGGFGITLFESIGVGREPAIVVERNLIAPSEIVDGIDILVLDEGFMILDSALGGSPKISTFDADGMLRGEVLIQRPGNPIGLVRASLFPDF